MRAFASLSLVTVRSVETTVQLAAELGVRLTILGHVAEAELAQLVRRRRRVRLALVLMSRGASLSTR